MAKNKRAWGPGNALWEWKQRNKSGGRKTRKYRGVKMARKGRRKSSGGGSFGLGSMLSMKNIAGTVGGAYAAPMVGQSPAIGAAVGSYVLTKKPLNAVVAYFAAPIIMGMIGGGSSKASSSQVLY